MFGELVRAHRKRRGITQEELADLAGLSARAIRAIETGRSTAPRAASRRLLADALELSGADRDQFVIAPAAPAASVNTTVSTVADPAALSGSPVFDPPNGATTITKSSSDGSWNFGINVRRPAGVPRQLPLALGSFAGRHQTIRCLDQFLADGTSTIAVISGSAGVGKSTLAVYWAHRVAEQFPDGQLFVNLGGFGPPGTLVDPAAAVRGFLHALGVPAQQIPDAPAEQAALYRSLLAVRRMLVVIDNARDADQVRPLVPAAEHCRVLVTSRHQLTGLVVTDGAFPIPLDLLSVEDSRQLLTRRLGHHRVTADLAAVNELIERCARLPLALAVVAGRAATASAFPLSSFAVELRRARNQLDAFNSGDAVSDARTVFSWSYRPLPAPAARLFRLIGGYTGPQLSVPAAASLVGVDLAEIPALLTTLSSAGLISEAAPGRFVLHDLLRHYASELVEQVEAASECHAARRRLLDHYLHTAAAADLLLLPHRAALPLSAASPGSVRTELTGRADAFDWFTVELEVLLALVRDAAELGFDAHAWQLASTLQGFLYLRGHWHEALTVQLHALPAAERIGDRYALALSQFHLGRAFINLNRFDEGHHQLLLAEAGYRELGDVAEQAQVHFALGVTFGRQGDYREALRRNTRALELSRQSGNRYQQAQAFNAIGWCSAHLGDNEQAHTYCEQALLLFEEIGDASGAGDTWDSIGFILLQRGEYADAINCYRRSVELYLAAGKLLYAATVLTDLAQIHTTIGQPTQARQALGEVSGILDDLDLPEANQFLDLLLRLDQPMVDATEAGCVHGIGIRMAHDGRDAWVGDGHPVILRDG